MDRIDRAKQFLPFDAMKGLQEALRAEEERMSRVERRELGEEDAAHISRILGILGKGDFVKAVFFRAGRYVSAEGKITRFDPVRRFLEVEGERIPFDDIGELERP